MVSTALRQLVAMLAHTLAHGLRIATMFRAELSHVIAAGVLKLLHALGDEVSTRLGKLLAMLTQAGVHGRAIAALYV